MRAIDTNVLARFILDDDPQQSVTARAIIADGVYVPLSVVLETAWLLISRYRQTRAVAAATLRDVALLAPVVFEAHDHAIWALDRSEEGADIADMIHLVSARSASSFATFDKGVQNGAGDAAPVPIETLA